MSRLSLGILASSGGAAGSFESIQTVTVGSGGSATVTFSSIPSTYSHLQVRWIAKSAGTETVEGGTLMVYADPHANNAWYHNLIGSGSAASAATSGGLSYSTQIAFISKSSNSGFGAGIFDVLDYSKTTKNKTYRSLSGWDDNGSGRLGLFSGMNNDTSAITTLTFAMNSGSNLAQYSSFALYGIKA